MKFFVEHRTDYVYDRPFEHAVQALRLTPPTGGGQIVHEWIIDAPGIDGAAAYVDGFGNLVHVVTPPGPVTAMTITARGLIETSDTGGVVGFVGEAAPPAVFLRRTPATTADKAIMEFAESVAAADRLSTLHALMAGVHGRVAYEVASTHSGTTAVEAFRAGRGVCQDHAQIFIAAARHLGIPGRYVTGYLHVEDESAFAHHAWAEAYTDELGWIGFDAANGICPTPAYARLACGLDAAAAAPVRGIRMGQGGETLTVEVVVRQSQQ